MFINESITKEEWGRYKSMSLLLSIRIFARTQGWLLDVQKSSNDQASFQRSLS
jgi:hypothetical protein